MYFGPGNELALRVRHRHSDGSWGDLDPRPSPHDAADHDPERGWKTGAIFVCRSCDEEVQIASAEDPDRPAD